MREKLGHSALWIHDPSTSRDMAYNWGLFDFHERHFVRRFLSGHMLYGIGRTTLDATLSEVRAEGRSVRAERIHLSAEQTRKVVLGARDAVLPGHRSYAYDPYLDNCTTRIRDLLDRGLGGRLHARTAGMPACRRARPGESSRRASSATPLSAHGSRRAGRCPGP